MGAAPSYLIQLQIMNLPKCKDGTLCEGHITLGLDSKTKKQQKGSSCCQQISA